MAFFYFNSDIGELFVELDSFGGCLVVGFLAKMYLQNEGNSAYNVRNQTVI